MQGPETEDLAHNKPWSPLPTGAGPPLLKLNVFRNLPKPLFPYLKTCHDNKIKLLSQSCEGQIPNMRSIGLCPGLRKHLVNVS